MTIFFSWFLTTVAFGLTSLLVFSVLGAASAIVPIWAWGLAGAIGVAAGLVIELRPPPPRPTPPCRYVDPETREDTLYTTY